jgi:hypothetical protein
MYPGVPSGAMEGIGADSEAARAVEGRLEALPDHPSPLLVIATIKMTAINVP